MTYFTTHPWTRLLCAAAALVLSACSVAGPPALRTLQEPPVAVGTASEDSAAGDTAVAPSGDEELSLVGPLIVWASPGTEGHWGYGHVPIGLNGYGLALGNPERWTGLRLNLLDYDAERVDGINFALNGWVTNGRGVTASPFFALAEDSLHGLQAGGLVVAAEKDLYGLGVGGGGIAAGSDVVGIHVGGLGLFSEGDQRGVNAAGLIRRAGGDSWGISAAGLRSIVGGGQAGLHAAGVDISSDGDQRGLCVGGVGVLAGGDVTGVALGGAGVVAMQDLEGVAAGGLTATFGESFTGVGIAGLTFGDNDTGSSFSPFGGTPSAELESSATGLMLAGYRVHAGRISGITGAPLNRTHVLEGLGVGGVNYVSGTQTGLSVGLYNHAADLTGVQIGLLNHVPENPWWARWLPIVNARF